MTKAHIEHLLACAERVRPGEGVPLSPNELAALCRIALIAIAAREATRKEVDDDV